MAPKRRKKTAAAGFQDGSRPSRASLSDLPPELHLEIIAYLPQVPFGLPGYFETDLRLNTLRALSQTCRYLRKLFEPLIWETFSVPVTWGPGNASMSSKLLRRCRGLAAREDLTKYVQFVYPTSCWMYF